MGKLVHHWRSERSWFSGRMHQAIQAIEDTLHVQGLIGHIHCPGRARQWWHRIHNPPNDLSPRPALVVPPPRITIGPRVLRCCWQCGCIRWGSTRNCRPMISSGFLSNISIYFIDHEDRGWCDYTWGNLVGGVQVYEQVLRRVIGCSPSWALGNQMIFRTTFVASHLTSIRASWIALSALTLATPCPFLSTFCPKGRENFHELGFIEFGQIRWSVDDLAFGFSMFWLTTFSTFIDGSAGKPPSFSGRLAHEWPPTCLSTGIGPVELGSLLIGRGTLSSWPGFFAIVTAGVSVCATVTLTLWQIHVWILRRCISGVCFGWMPLGLPRTLVMPRTTGLVILWCEYIFIPWVLVLNMVTVCWILSTPQHVGHISWCIFNDPTHASNGTFQLRELLFISRESTTEWLQ